MEVRKLRCIKRCGSFRKVTYQEIFQDGQIIYHFWHLAATASALKRVVASLGSLRFLVPRACFASQSHFGDTYSKNNTKHVPKATEPHIGSKLIVNSSVNVCSSFIFAYSDFDDSATSLLSSSIWKSSTSAFFSFAITFLCICAISH